MNTNEIRELFFSFYEERGHKRVASSSLVLTDDPTLLFTNAGMNQFKERFIAPETSDLKRAVSSQKCLRISGKHNDLEEVGHSARHNTFFEMLGNFSFGDYFKKDAILFAWEFVVHKLQFDIERLWVTIFQDDDEAFTLWTDIAGVRPERIIRLGEKDNFWAMGDTGPCGPCSEIHYYTGDDLSIQSEKDFLLEDGRYIEFYNLVFMQYNRDESGVLHPLSRPSIDTGLGLERVTHLKMGAKSNYDSQGLRDIIAFCEERSGLGYEGKEFAKTHYQGDAQYLRDVSMRVIADHTRAVTMLIAEGVQPGSDGRGYVLRRLIRRAVRHGKSLGFEKPFLFEAAKVMQQVYSQVFPEITEQAEHIERVLRAEEEKFRETLESGLRLLEQEKMKLQPGALLSGATAFLLHDTYGFPLDLTADALRADGIGVDEEGFRQAMAEQRSRSRADRKSKKLEFTVQNFDCAPTEFLGYEALECETALLYRSTPEQGSFFLAKATPFYGESGGQVGDTGAAVIEGARVEILDTQKTAEGHFLHFVAPEMLNTIPTTAGTTVQLAVNTDRRRRIAANHSATHLLHSALRERFGEHVRQAGSRVDEFRTRFDYAHFESPNSSDIEAIERFVTAEILENHQVLTREMPIDEARALGAMALFGEKYGDVVRVVQIGANSTELCGGTHVQQSGEIGGFFVTSEASISSGVRRIECIHGDAVLAELQRTRREALSLAEMVGGAATGLEERIQSLIERSKLLEKQIEALQQKLLGHEMGGLLSERQQSQSGIHFICARVGAQEIAELRASVDSLRAKIGSGVVVLIAQSADGNGLIAGGTTNDVKVHIGKLLGAVLQSTGGRGGGRDTFAQGGGVAPEKIDELLKLTRGKLAEI